MPKVGFICLFLPFLFIWVRGSLATESLHPQWDFVARDENETSVIANNSLILAANRTCRKDPLNGFKYYLGGWNISNRDYWASVGFSAAPLFGIAVAWFALFGLALLGLLIHHFCKKKVDVKVHPHAYPISLVLLIIFTCGGIAGSIMLYNGQGQFHSSITDTLDFVISEAEVTAEGLRNITDIISLALVNGIDEVLFSVDNQRKLDTLNRKLKTATRTLESKTNENSRKIKRVLDDVRIILIILAAVMLFLAFTGLWFSIRGHKALVYSLVLIAGVLVAATFILSGVFLLLTNVVGDACVSMQEWVAHPYANTSLDEILPCMDVETAEQSLTQSKELTSQLVEATNIVVTTVANSNQSIASIFGYNQSGPLMPLLCNPYTNQLKKRNCTAGEVSLADAPTVWKNYTCSISSSGICETSGRLTPTLYNELNLTVQISYALYHYGPFLLDLQDCSFVRDAFSKVTSDYCPNLRQQLRWVYIGLAFVATGIMLSLVLWVIYSKQRSQRDAYYSAQKSESNRQFIVRQSSNMQDEEP